MKKLLWVTLTVLLIIFLVPPAFSGGDFSAFDSRYCQVIEDTKFCIVFQQAPFGPGYQGEAFLISTPTEVVFGPVDDTVISLGAVSSRDGVKVVFQDLDYQGQFDENGLEIFHVLLRFQIDS